MTETSKNIPLVLARYHRAALRVVRDLTAPKPDLDDGQRTLLADAFATLEALPEEIEQLTALPGVAAPYLPPGVIQ